MTLAAITAAAITVAASTAGGCTFCTCHARAFEDECHARGGEVVTLDTTQLCVPPGGAGSGSRVGGLADDDGGTP